MISTPPPGVAVLPTPPANAVVADFAPLFQALGAADVQATGHDTVTLTYHHNSRAVNAEALLNDNVRGASILIDNRSLTTDFPRVDAESLTSLLKGVAGLQVEVQEGATPGSSQLVVFPPDQATAGLLGEVVDPDPTPDIGVHVHTAPPAAG